MGELSQTYFGTNNLSRAIVLAGHQEKPFWEVFGDLDEEFSCKTACFSSHLLSNPRLTVIRRVYGVASAYDAVKTPDDGNCRSMVFVGWAQSRGKHDIGEVVMPTKIKGLDSISKGEAFEPEIRKKIS